MSESLRAHAATRVAAAASTVVVEVVATRGSVPRESGTRMLVWDDGTEGTIGGGRLEWEAVIRAREALAGRSAWPQTAEVVLGASLGQCCGGAVTLRYRLLDAEVLASWTRPASPPIQVYGAGHVGRAVVRVLETLDANVQWIDEREGAFPATPSGPTIERVCVEPVEAEVAVAPAGASYLVLTHQHDLDLRIVEAILRRGDFAFLGLIGSRTKRRRFEQQLERRGIGRDRLDRMTCPIGIDGIAGKEPPVIAIAVVAQWLRTTGGQATGHDVPPAFASNAGIRPG